jgi:osmotically-inducible protein OsmY
MDGVIRARASVLPTAFALLVLLPLAVGQLRPSALVAAPRLAAGYDDSGLEARARSRLARDTFLSKLSLTLSVKDGVARLAGEVDSLEQAERARRAVAQTRGLVELEVALEVPAGLENDIHLESELTRAFGRFPSLKEEKLEARVEQGRVRLGGSVRTAGQRLLVLEAARGVRGVRGVDMQLDVREGADDDDARLEKQIRGLLADRLRFPIQGRVQVRVREREAILEGTVQRVIDRLDAEQVAWFAGGVRRVQNLVMVVPRPRIQRVRELVREEGEENPVPESLQDDPETPDAASGEESNESEP